VALHLSYTVASTSWLYTANSQHMWSLAKGMTIEDETVVKELAYRFQRCVPGQRFFAIDHSPVIPVVSRGAHIAVSASSE